MRTKNMISLETNTIDSYIPIAPAYCVYIS